MGKLLISVVIILVLSIFWVGSAEYAYYQKINYYSSEQVEQIHQAGDILPIPSEYYTFINLSIYLFYISCIIVFLLSLFYMFKNSDSKGYFKSLIIPVCFILFSFIGATILSQNTSIFSGEGGLKAVIPFFILLGLLILTGIANLFIYLVRRH